MAKKKNFIIIGSGLFGCVLAERIANDLGSNVHIFDKRDHIGGNCYSFQDPATKIDIHKYGPHIFHTNKENVWKYMNQFTQFNDYVHKIKVNYKNKLYTFPINLQSINMIYNTCTSPHAVDACLNKDRVFVDNPANFKEMALQAVGRRLYNIYYKGYTTKQWKMDPKKLPASIFQRNPIRYDHVDRVFNDKYEGIPIDGYTNMFKNMLKHKKIKVFLNERMRMCNISQKTNPIIIYTGKLDEIFKYCYGDLDWISLKFQEELHKINDYQGIAQMNYTDESIPYTRVIEHKHFQPQNIYKDTIITYEYPIKNNYEPYYPINTYNNNLLYSKYRKIALNTANFYFGGRLADYKYYNMDDTIDAALKLYEKIKKDVDNGNNKR